MDLIETWGRITLAVLLFIGIGGIFYHGWLSNRLAFVRFTDSDTSNKKGLKRVIVPLILVALLCAIAPVVIIYTHQGLLEALQDPDEVNFVKFPWKYVMPTASMEVSIMFCAFIGSFFYFGMGLLSWLIWKIAYGARYGRN